MIAPLGAPTFREALRWAAETFHALGDAAARAGSSPPPSATRAATPRASASNEDGHRGGARRRSSAPATRPASRSPSRSTRPPPSCTATARYTLAREGRSLTSREMIDFWADWADRYPIVSLEDGLAEDDWDGWAALTDAPRRPGPARRRRPARHQHRPPGARHPRAHARQQHPRQAQPDRHADRDDRGGRDGAARGLDRGHQPSLRRDGGHDHRRPGGRPQHRARSRPAP